MKIMVPAWVDGKLTPVEKLEAHQRGLRHKAVSVFVMRAGALLIQRRALGKYHTPGLWANTCCTHPEWGEASEACATRRLREELGIEDQRPKFRQRVEYRADVGGGLIEHEVVDIFLVEATGDMSLAPDPSEVMQTRWITIADLNAELRSKPNLYTPWMRIYMEEHADAIFGESLVAAQ